jgi:hypothetical protein
MGNAADAGLLPVNTNSSLANNYASTTLRTQDSSTADGRIDFRFDNTQSVFVRYSFNNVDTFTPSACDATPEGIQPGCGGGPAFPGENNTKAHGTQVNYVRIFSPTMIAEVKGGYLKSNIQSLPLNYGSNLSSAFGIPGVNFDDVTSGLALMTLTGYSALGDSTFIPLIQIDDTWQPTPSSPRSSASTTSAWALVISGGSSRCSRAPRRLGISRSTRSSPITAPGRAAIRSRRSSSGIPRKWRGRTR